MTENMKVAMSAINKWFYYAMNYNVVEVEVLTFKGKETHMLPDFFNALPMYLRAHIESKWEYAYGEYGSRAALMWLYGELDWANRKSVMEWVLTNYNDEQPIPFNEEEE